MVSPSSIQQILTELATRLATGGRFATQLQVQQPVSASPLAFPVKAEYCPGCHLDLFTNPDATVWMHQQRPDPLDDLVTLRCNCGRQVEVPAYLFQ